MARNKFRKSQISIASPEDPASEAIWHAKKTVTHARNLLGQHLVRRWPDGRVEARMITEVEAYDGERDLACHAARGRTARTEILYGAGGRWYVYLCYGIHELLNLVVGPPGWPAAVLIRSVEGVAGPGRLTKALGIDRRLNGRAARPASDLWVEDRRSPAQARRIRATPRIGMDYAGGIWAAKRWRFILLPPPGAGSGPGSRRPRRS